jgi:integrase
LKAARDARDAARGLLDAGTDPSEDKKQDKRRRAEADTFAPIADELVEKKRAERRADATIKKTKWLIAIAKGALGSRPVREIDPPEILAVLRPFEADAHFETANRLRAIIGQVFRYAVATGRATSDPTRDLRGAIAAPKPRHRAAIVEPSAFGELLRAVADYRGAPETRIALELLALTFVRPGELRAADWAEFDLEARVWVIPAGKMKMRRPHKVPLSERAAELLRELRGMARRSRFLFPSLRTADRSMSENTLNAALRRLGYDKDEMTAHGFRAAASSILNESGLWNADAIEAQLAHIEGNAVRRAYARAEFWDERVRMMAWWCEKLVELRDAPRRADVIELRSRR